MPPLSRRRAVFLAAVLACLGFKPAFAETAQSIPWMAPAHVQFFRYQVYLKDFFKRQGAKDLPYQTPDSWAALKPEEQAAKVKEGEKLLQDRFSDLSSRSYLSPDDEELVKAVWGDQAGAMLKDLVVARSLGDPSVVEQARKKVDDLAKKLHIARDGKDGRQVFDGGSISVEGALDATTEEKQDDPLAVKKAAPFQKSLKAIEVKEALASQKSFDAFIGRQDFEQVSRDARPALRSMYAVLTQAKGPEESETSHIMPTVVRFIMDGHKVVMAGCGAEGGALACAVPDEYGGPSEIHVTPLIREADPIAVGDVLAHEYEHVYDQYTGRFYTLDSELRGFKTNVLYGRILKRVAPKKYEELLNGNDATRQTLTEMGWADEAYSEGPERFEQEIGLGHQYTRVTQGYVAEARLPLSRATDPEQYDGVPKQLAAALKLRADAKRRLDALEAQRDRLAMADRTGGSVESDKQFEQVSRDLGMERALYDSYDRMANTYQLQLSRLKHEADWLAAKSAAKGQAASSYDLNLSVDDGYEKDPGSVAKR